jgi:hypothetical protein
MANNHTVNNGVSGQTEEDTDQPYSVARYEESTSGPWNNILDVPSTETWPGQPVYTTGDSPNGSYVALNGSDENLPRTEDGDKKAKHKKTDRKGGKSDHKKDGKGASKKDDKKDKKDGDGKGKGKHHHSHKSHGHGHSSHRAA